MTMRRAIPGLVLFAAACGTSAPTEPAKPAAPTTTLTGSVSASNDGAPLSGLTVTSAGVSAVTGGNGAFALNVQANVFRQVDVTGDGIIPRTIWSLGPTATIDVIRLDPGSGVDLTYYQQLVRDALESPENLGYVRRWNLAPRLYVRSVDEANVPIDQKVINFAVGVVRDTIPIWTDGKLSLAEVQQGTAAATLSAFPAR